jgi:predicted DNA-binding transcriptional regulator AlpA
MFNVSLDQDTAKSIYLEEVRKRVDEIEQQRFLIDTKELCKMLSLSRPTVEKLFICKPDFPVIRIGKKLLYNRKEIEVYIDEWGKNIRKKGGQVEWN